MITQITEDPLCEKHAYVCKGVIQKFEKRVLVELTLRCAKYCDYCCRKWKVGSKSLVLSRKDISNIGKFLNENTKINEVVISGGDPFTEPDNLVYFLRMLGRIKSVNIIRVHTRFPVDKPQLMSDKILKQINKSKKPIYVALHVNVVTELNRKVIRAIEKLRKSGAILYSHSVMLYGINDKVEVLLALYEKLLTLGVRPYYIYHCNNAIGNEKYIVPLEKEIEIMTMLRSKLSGLAYPILIVDSPDSAHKIPVPLLNWRCDISRFTDYFGKNHSLREIDRI